LNNKKTALRVVQSYNTNFCGRFRLHTRRSIYKIPLISKVIDTKTADVQIGDSASCYILNNAKIVKKCGLCKFLSDYFSQI